MAFKRAEPSLYAVVAQFGTAEEVLAAANRARLEGFQNLEAYTPFPVHGLDEAIGFRDVRVKWIIFAAGVMGAIGGISLQYYVHVIDYPMNVGGRPNFSWPSFVPVTFESMVLLAAFGAVIGMLALNGLPQPYHPIFNTPGFQRASQDKFFLAFSAREEGFDLNKTKEFLASLRPEEVEEVMA